MRLICALLCSFLGLLPFQCFHCLKMVVFCMTFLPQCLYFSIYILAIMKPTLIAFGQFNYEFSRLYNNIF